MEGKGKGFAEALQKQVPDGVQVELTDCMNQCDQPMSLALRGPRRDVYLFSGVDPQNDLADATALVRLWIDAPGGTIQDARPAGRLRFCLVGRVPH